MSAKVEFVHAAGSSQGKRKAQEDFSSVWQPEEIAASIATRPLLVAVADGMGGHVGGQVASKLACEQFIQSFTVQTADVGPRLVQALEDSNHSIATAVGDDGGLRGMGCTLLAGYLDATGLRWVSVGDSTLLFYRDGNLYRVNADHSHGARLDKQAEAGLISQQAAKADPRRHALHSALTGDRIPLQDLSLQPVLLVPNDVVIFATDGLLTLSGDAIATLVRKHEHDTPERIADELIASVDKKHAPRQDNTTIVIVQVKQNP